MGATREQPMILHWFGVCVLLQDTAWRRLTCYHSGTEIPCAIQGVQADPPNCLPLSSPILAFLSVSFPFLSLLPSSLQCPGARPPRRRPPRWPPGAPRCPPRGSRARSTPPPGPPEHTVVLVPLLSLFFPNTQWFSSSVPLASSSIGGGRRGRCGAAAWP